MKTIIFDFDGTLADSFELVLEIASEITGIAHPGKEEIERLRHLPLARVVQELKIPILRLPLLLFKGRQRMLERIDEIHPFKGIPEALQTLHQQGNHLLVISSNSEQNVRTFLRSNNLENYFDGVYGSVAVFNKSAALKKVIKRNKLQVADCYYVGDEVRDVVAAARVHVEPVAVAWGYQAPEALAKYHPFALVKKPADLVAVIAGDHV